MYYPTLKSHKLSRILFINIIQTLLLVTTNLSIAQNNASNYACTFADAFAMQDFELWRSTMDSLQNEKYLKTNHELMEIDLLSYYGAIAWYIRYEGDSARLYTDSLEICLKKYEDSPKLNTIHHMLSVSNAFFKAYLYRWLSPYYGSIAYYKLNTADSIIKSSEYYWTEMGNSRYHVPMFLGKDYKLSAEYYSNSVEIHRSENANCSWYFLNTLLWQARSFQKGGNVAKSLDIYNQILEENPRFDTVKKIIQILEQDSTVRF